jgi:exodeoxyribonuclease V gamma subunit
VRDLLDVPALGARFGLVEGDMALLGAWIDGAGVRWGLDQRHRDGLGLGPAGEQNAWIFGIRRMLLGYASGHGAQYAGIEPYAEVGGLDAALAGSLAQLVDTLLQWRARLSELRTPAQWGIQARALLAAFFKEVDDADRLTLAQLDQALLGWLEICEHAGYDELVPLAVLREAWLGSFDEPTLNHQFVSGGVTFCTLMPMRAVPFRVVCLLGMNDGDYPRRTSGADFDLLALPGMARPGDRSRRDDDRYLMLEALLAVRDKLYISWVGRNVRDNSLQPPSVLVSQLRDYLEAGWKFDPVSLTTEHALQPFSRRYFEQGGLLTYAGEWRAAHGSQRKVAEAGVLAPFELDVQWRLTLRELAAFVRQPVKHFFRRRLGVVFVDSARLGEDEEPFGLNALERYMLEDAMLEDTMLKDTTLEDAIPQDPTSEDCAPDVRASLELRADQLARSGLLPIGLVGQHMQRQLVDALVPVRRAWLGLCAQYPQAADKVALELRYGDVAFEDWLDQLRSDGDGSKLWLLQMSSKVLSSKPKDKKKQLRGDKLIGVWLRQLAAAAANCPVTGILVARDAILTLRALDPDAAREAMQSLFALWRSNMDSPMPTACKTALVMLQEGDARSTYEGGFQMAGESDDLCLARLWPDFASLEAEEAWIDCSRELYGPLLEWLEHGVTIELIGAEGDDA